MGHIFHNWDESLVCDPSVYAQPKAEEEIVQLVKNGPGPVRAVGAGHSWSPLVLTQGTLVNLDNMGGLVHADHETGIVTVQAGVRLHNLIDLLSAEGLALKNLGAVTQQSIGGATGAGTHGSGIQFGAIHTQIVGVRIVTGRGEVLELEQGRDDEDLRAARLSLGALGIVTQLKLACVKNANLKLEEWKSGFDFVIRHLEEFVRDNAHVRFYWFPGSDQMYINTMNPTDEPATPQNAVSKWFEDVFVRKFAMGAFWRAGELLHAEIPTINKIEENLGFNKVSRVGLSASMLTTAMPPKHIECEYAVPFKNAATALVQLKEMVTTSDKHVNVPAEIRFVKQDDNYLSPAFDGDICYIGAYMTGEELASSYIPRYEEIVIPLGGKPQWGKRFNMPFKDVRALYPEFSTFDKIRRKFDPSGRMLNPFLANLFS